MIFSSASYELLLIYGLLLVWFQPRKSDLNQIDPFRLCIIFYTILDFGNHNFLRLKNNIYIFFYTGLPTKDAFLEIT